MTSPSIRIAVPPSRIQDLDRLFALQRDGFMPSGSVYFDPEAQAFAVDLDGDAVSHLLDLLSIAMDLRGAETWQERRAREANQLRLQLASEDIPYADRSVQFGG